MTDSPDDQPSSAPPGAHERRLLVVLPTWIGDAVMATPALRRLRDALPGYLIGVLSRPGPDALLAAPHTPKDDATTPSLFDELHLDRRAGIMGPKRAAAKLRARRYDHALLLTNSFSSALTVRMAGIPERTGYDRDGRGFLLTHRLTPKRHPDGSWALIPAIDYYHHAADALLTHLGKEPARFPRGPMELPLSPADQDAATDVLHRAGIEPDQSFAVLNPGGNNEAKRWPADRFAALAQHLFRAHHLRCVVTGSPHETELCDAIARESETNGVAAAISLPALGLTIPALKGVVARASLMVTNDTGPRHIAAAFGIPLVSLFGPTDHRWTTIPTRPGAPELILVADPTLPETESANDHPQRCAVDRISLDRVVSALEDILSGELSDSAVR